MEEAILQGYLELVERDAAAIWWYNRLTRPAVDLESLENPYLHEVMAYYASIGRGLHVLDITTDLGIPVFAAISYSLEGDEGGLVLYAFGAHVDAGIAVERAVIEVNQLLPVVLSGDGVKPDPEFAEWLRTASLATEPYLSPSRERPRQFQQDYPPLCPATIYDSIQFCLAATTQAGLETLVLDLTQPDIGLPVVKVIVPGLRHMWRRTAPGRLYEVPVKLGWLQKPLTEEQLNPISIFI